MKTFRRVGAFALTMLMICLCLIVVAFTQDIQDENYTDYEPVQSIEQRQAVPEVAARPSNASTKQGRLCQGHRSYGPGRYRGLFVSLFRRIWLPSTSRTMLAAWQRRRSQPQVSHDNSVIGGTSDWPPNVSRHMALVPSLRIRSGAASMD